MAVSTCLPLAQCKHEPAHTGHSWVTATAAGGLGYCQGAGDVDQLPARACQVVTMHHGHVWAPPGLAELRWCLGDGQAWQQEPPHERPRRQCTAGRFHPEHPWLGDDGWCRCPGLKPATARAIFSGAEIELKFASLSEAAAFMRWWHEHGALAWALQGDGLRYHRIATEGKP